MFRASAIFLTVALVVHGNAAHGGGKFNRKIKIGDPAPSFANLPGVDGKKHSLNDLKDKDVIVLVVTCNHCPVAQAYEGRMIDFVNNYAGPGAKVSLVALCVNLEEDDSLPQMIKHAKEKAFNFPYLADTTQTVGRALGATATPEFFVLDKNRKVVYMGAMDDATNPSNVKTNYLVPAVQAALAGSTPTVAETAARGCTISYRASK